MSSRIADIPVPSECGYMIRSGALVAVNTSGGKDSHPVAVGHSPAGADGHSRVPG